MINLPNVFTLLRLPLALVFLKQNVALRVLVIVLAMISDGLDGFVARKYRLVSRVGTVLDPLMDRFFVFFVIGVLIQENVLTPWQAGTLLCRDFAVLLFGVYLTFTGRLLSYRFHAIFCGKVTTFLQFVTFLLLSLGIPLPSWFFLTFVLLGFLTLFELYFRKDYEIIRET